MRGPQELNSRLSLLQLTRANEGFRTERLSNETKGRRGSMSGGGKQGRWKGEDETNGQMLRQSQAGFEHNTCSFPGICSERLGGHEGVQE